MFKLQEEVGIDIDIDLYIYLWKHLQHGPEKILWGPGF